MNGYYLHHKKKLTIYIGILMLLGAVMAGRLCYIMVAQSVTLTKKADELHERERQVKAPRGIIYDRNGVELAGNRSVCTISVIHSQIEEEEKVIEVLTKYLDVPKERIAKLVKKRSSREKIKSNVDKALAEKIRAYQLAGVMIDEDYKRYYPFSSLASKVLGFTGGDNQGIVGLEVQYDDVLMGKPGYILTTTDAAGHRVEHTAEQRKEAVPGNDLITSLDYSIQMYAEQAAKKVQKEKEAKNVSVIVMNPQNGEIYACVNTPEYDLNDPFTLTTSADAVSTEKKQEQLNQMWRNTIVNDTYEPGSTFKIITATAALEEGVVTPEDTFVCPGFKIVEDRKIRCHKVGGHGTETFKQGVMNSCNPVFMTVGERVGAKNMYRYYKKLGLFEKTGIDVPGEAGSIMHKLEDVKAVELATMSFGQSFQITPFQLLRAAAAVVNGGTLITPHFGVAVEDSVSGKRTKLQFPTKKGAVSKKTSETMKELLDAVVSEGSGKNAAVPGYAIGGKTATSEKLPRGNGRYISSFLGFARSDDPTVMALLLINEPTGIYYGGTIAAPVVGDLFKNILPYLGIEQTKPVTEKETKETSLIITD
ncbi:MAG: penicillin-binding transpeptidase domain-containing protein [Lachnospiraceae bacterium]|nr:penicillin-binding transpeptidase domain-containing protein [Lachnospiraceae bacterium]